MIEFWFDFAINYSYLSAARIGGLARTAGINVEWIPFLLGPIFRELGMNNSPFVLQKEKGAYIWKDMARQGRKYGLPPWTTPSVFPRSGVLPARIAIQGLDKAWLENFCTKVFELNFVHDQDINDRAQISAVLRSLEIDPSIAIQQAEGDDAKRRLRNLTSEARARGVFGAPTFFVGSEMFWGTTAWRMQSASRQQSRAKRDVTRTGSMLQPLPQASAVPVSPWTA